MSNDIEQEIKDLEWHDQNDVPDVSEVEVVDYGDGE